MSNIGKKPIIIPKNYQITLRKYTNFNQILIKSPSFSKYINVPTYFSFNIIDNNLFIFSSIKTSFLGTLHRKIQQILTGSFKKSISVIGVGYKLELKGDKIVTDIGYSHIIEYKIPKNIKITQEKANTLIGESNSLEALTQFFSTIWLVKPSEKDKYKGKGYKIS